MATTKEIAQFVNKTATTSAVIGLQPFRCLSDLQKLLKIYPVSTRLAAIALDTFCRALGGCND